MSCTNFTFLGYEPLYGRIGLGIRLEEVTEAMKRIRIQEITTYYKDQFKFADVRVIEDENDPYMSLVFVKISQPYATNFYKAL